MVNRPGCLPLPKRTAGISCGTWGAPSPECFSRGSKGSRDILLGPRVPERHAVLGQPRTHPPPRALGPTSLQPPNNLACLGVAHTAPQPAANPQASPASKKQHGSRNLVLPTSVSPMVMAAHRPQLLDGWDLSQLSPQPSSPVPFPLLHVPSSTWQRPAPGKSYPPPHSPAEPAAGLPLSTRPCALAQGLILISQLLKAQRPSLAAKLSTPGLQPAFQPSPLGFLQAQAPLLVLPPHRFCTSQARPTYPSSTLWSPGNKCGGRYNLKGVDCPPHHAT